MIVEEFNNKKERIGFWNRKNKTYNTTRDYNLNQVYKYKEEPLIAVDKKIIVKRSFEVFPNLKSLSELKLVVLLKNMPNRSDYYVEINFFEFYNNSEESCEDKYDKEGNNITGYGKQLRCPLRLFKERIPELQEVLI